MATALSIARLEAIFQTTGLERTQMGNLDTTIAGNWGERKIAESRRVSTEPKLTQPPRDEGAHGNGLQDSPGHRIARVGNHPSRVFHRSGNAGLRGASRSARTATRPRSPATRTVAGSSGRRRASASSSSTRTTPATIELVGEVTADDAKIEWKVDLCNRKAALDRNFGPVARPTQCRHRGPRGPSLSKTRSR